MPPKKGAKKKVAAKGFKLPDPIAPGQILTDLTRNQWRLGKSIGQGGFGEIYAASNIINREVAEDAKYVIKVEPHSNGPLFTEMHCYMHIAKPEYIESWKKEKKMKRLGMPKYMGSGSFNYEGQKYRFMVMERFGEDLQKILEKHNKQFSYKTVFQIAIQILDVLEYIHSYEYIHADIKASNLLIGHQPGTENQVFLVDYGLACRYKNSDGTHKPYKPDVRKAHDGTIEFTSRDAHIGVHSRRGDLEILGYNLVQWLCGKLPWEDKLQDCNYVANKKRALMDDVPRFMNVCFPDGVPQGVREFIDYVTSLTFDEQPNYDKFRTILRDGLKKRGYKDDGKLVFMSATPKASSKKLSKVAGRKKAVKRRSEEEENIGETLPKKKFPADGRSPCKPRNFNRCINTRFCLKKNDSDPNSNKPSHPDSFDLSFDSIIEKENLKMLEKKKQQRPKRNHTKKDTSLENPTPQMLEIMEKMREKSVSPPICMKRHRHNSNCQQGFRVSPSAELPPNDLTPAMEEVMKKRSKRGLSTDSDTLSRESCSPSGSSEDLFNSDSEVEEVSDEEVSDEEEVSEYEEEVSEDEGNKNVTVYYSPCGSTSPSVDCVNHKHNKAPSKVPVRNYSARRMSVSREKMTRLRSRKGSEIKSPACEMRVTRSNSRYSTSPEIF